MSNPDNNRGSGRSPVVFYIITLLLPIAFFGLLEGAVRVLGIAAVEPLFVDGPPGYLRPNEAVMNRFFIHSSRAPRVSIDTTFFRKEKGDDVFRVVVQGGSSAAGFPYGKWASLAGMLGQRLRRSEPNRDIEVISTAMSAINSYALVDFADEIVAIDPDAVLIYAGHNEYLGVLGVGSAYGAGRSPAYTRFLLHLRRSHLFRAMQSAYGAMTPAPDSEAQRSGTLMARIAHDRAIAYGSPVYRAGVEQFSHNLSELLAHYATEGVPVLIGSLASNENGQSPFINEAGDETSFAALHELKAGASAEDNDANGFFTLAQQLERSGKPVDARNAYGWARDLDALRFRAPSEMNRVIREVAAATRATVVDVESALANSSRNGIVGNSLMLEHLHPNLRGYFLLADAYFQALIRRPGELSWNEGPERAVAWQEIPVTEVEELAAGYRLRYLKADWPFQEQRQQVTIEPPKDPVAQIAQNWFFGKISWQQAMQEALTHYQNIGRLDQAAKIAMNLAEAFPFESRPHYVSGRLLIAAGQPERALSYLVTAVRVAPDDSESVFALSEAYLAAGRPDDARRVLDVLLRRRPNDSAIVERLRAITGEQ
jgi:tetratricopeptide (TPR) repeat protein